jgi:hypothetical protein
MTLTYFVAALIVGVVGLLVYVIRTSKVRLPLLMDTGLAMLAVGIGTWIQPLLGDSYDSRVAIAMRVLLPVLGVLLVLIAWANTLIKRRASGNPMKRAADSMAGELGPALERRFPPAPPARRR